MAAQYQENNNTCIQRLTSLYDDETYSEEALTAPLSTLGDVINDTGNILDFFYDAVNQGDIGSTKKILCELLDQSKRCKKCMPDECKQVNVGIHFDLIAILDIEKLLCTAAQKRHVEILQLLLKSLPYDKLATGSKLLELALELKDAVIVKSVLDSGVDVDERINGSYIRWGSLVTYTFPLHEATSAGDEITVRMLIDYGAQLDFTDSDGNTAVMLACAGSSLDVLCLLLKAGADLDLTDFNDRSALVIAAALNKTDMMHLIFENGGQISERMLLRACEISSVSASALKLLLKGLRNGGFDIDWYRLLQTATHFNKPENVQVLLNHMPCTLKKAGPRAQDILTIALHKKHFLENTVNILFEEEFIKAEGVDSHGNQPLHVAVKYCSPEFCFKLSQAEDLDSADCAGMTPLMLCLYRDRHEDCGVSSAQTAATIIKQLLQQGANINVQDRSGCTSVHHAVIVGNSPALVVLVEAGADLTMCDENGKNPLDLAWSKAFSTHPFSPFRDLRSDILSGNDCLWVENEYLMVTRGQRLYLENRAETLSFVRVSDLLGFQSGRENRVKNLGLPPSIQLPLPWVGQAGFLRHLLPSKVLVTLLCRHAYLLWLRATLQELRTCSVVCLPWHSGHVGSSFILHRTRFAFEGNTGRPYTAQIRKLILSGVMCHILFHQTSSSNLPFLMDRLRDLFGLELILLQFIRASNQTHSAGHDFLSAQDRSVVMKALRNGKQHPPPRSAGLALPSAALRITSLA
ncbi:serine/threonine-protein phosphatase 6 regulatory ankyrin repeat subunit c [Plakobranchus ocellatus]|uniref:Serine/threonine-protein phosphatase 6 regulatory ankyrin repeat subunit c n=1 Tax=Plakobranchus ocellatus TaxID=259542 RepID=A0AAV4AWD3_9GAST|nr:serine/threonine-protein phosphatase 6 regulatory ankyrin repeat subunit c [Plakobranchus ocellatus]